MKISANEARTYLSKEKRDFADNFLDAVYDEIYEAARKDKREVDVFKGDMGSYETSFYVKKDLEDHGYVVQMDRFCDGFTLKIHW